MKSTSLVAALIIAVSSPLTHAETTATGNVSPMASCGNITSQRPFPGGFEVGRYCGNTTVSGVGTTLDAAMQNAGNFGSLVPAKGCRVESRSDISAVPGGYRTQFHCTGEGRSGYVGGFGTTATDAAANAYQFGQLFADLNAASCSIPNTASSYTGFVGGYFISFTCNNLPGYRIAPGIDGVGTTATDAGVNALGFAALLAERGIACTKSGQGVRREGMLYRVDFYCGARSVTGYGTTATAAGFDALLNAQAL